MCFFITQFSGWHCYLPFCLLTLGIVVSSLASFPWLGAGALVSSSHRSSDSIDMEITGKLPTIPRTLKRFSFIASFPLVVKLALFPGGGLFFLPLCIGAASLFLSVAVSYKRGTRRAILRANGFRGKRLSTFGANSFRQHRHHSFLGGLFGYHYYQWEQICPCFNLCPQLFSRFDYSPSASICFGLFVAMAWNVSEKVEERYQNCMQLYTILYN